MALISTTFDEHAWAKDLNPIVAIYYRMMCADDSIKALMQNGITPATNILWGASERPNHQECLLLEKTAGDCGETTKSRLGHENFFNRHGQVRSMPIKRLYQRKCIRRRGHSKQRTTTLMAILTTTIKTKG
mgnify:FL=1|jgi:hypothetical protein